jgi:hypothetical protein
MFQTPNQRETNHNSGYLEHDTRQPQEQTQQRNVSAADQQQQQQCRNHQQQQCSRAAASPIVGFRLKIMFSFLTDNIEHVVPPIVLAAFVERPPPAPFARGRGRRGGGGRNSGFQHSQTTIANITAGAQKRLRRCADNETRILQNAISPSLQTFVSAEIMSPSTSLVPHGPARRQLLIGDQTVTTRKHGHGHHDFANGLDRAVVSHTAAQANGLGALLSDTSHAWFINVFDDASMWISKTELQTCHVKPHELFARRLSRKGKNVHMPVLNMEQHIFAEKCTSISTPMPLVVGSLIHAPAQVLPAANASTVHDRWARWSITAVATGRKLDDGNLLGERLTQVPWKTLVMCKDNLILNDCLVALELKACNEERQLLTDNVNDTTVLDLNCIGHSAVLCTKPIVKALQIDTHLVRMSHILEGGRSWDQYIQHITDIARESFKYKQCAILPAEAAEWRAINRSILERSRPAQDLTLDDEELILDTANHKWGHSEDAIHWCVPNCRLDCKGDEGKSREHFVACSLMVAGGPMCVCLIYRWKAFDKAAAFAFRARKFYDLLRRGLKRMFSANVVLKARTQLELLEAAEADTMAASTARKTVRGGKIVEWLDRDLEGNDLHCAIALNNPIQHYLNAGFAAEAATTAISETYLRTPPSAANALPETDDLLQKAIDLNWSFISGSRGQDVVKGYSSMLLDLNSPGWTDLALSNDEKRKASSAIMLSMAESWYRLVHRFDDSKFKVFRSCTSREPNDILANNLTRPILDKMVACPQCVGRFAGIWAKRLLNHRQCIRKRSHHSLRCILATLPVTSARCERKHLLGQETSGKKRGKRLQASKLSKVTYCKSVQKAAAAMQKRVVDSVFKSKKIYGQWTNTLASLEVNAPRKQGRKRRADGQVSLTA